MQILKEFKVIRTLIKYKDWNELTYDIKYRLHKGARVTFVNKKNFLVLYESKKNLMTKDPDNERGDIDVSITDS
jgi:hypothetical protein